MIEFAKKILLAVSFDKFLFAKEYQKLRSWMNEEERKSLHAWCLAHIDKTLLVYTGISIGMDL